MFADLVDLSMPIRLETAAQYSNHFVSMSLGVYECVYVSTIKRKPLIGMT